MPEPLERRLRAAADTLDALGESAPAEIGEAWDYLIDHVLPMGDLDAIDTLLSAIEALFVRLVSRSPKRARRAAEQRKLRQARTGLVRLQCRCELRHRQRIAQAGARTRPRARRRRRHGARRAGGVRSGQDPGEGEPPPGDDDRHVGDLHAVGGRS